MAVVTIVLAQGDMRGYILLTMAFGIDKAGRAVRGMDRSDRIGRSGSAASPPEPMVDHLAAWWFGRARLRLSTRVSRLVLATMRQANGALQSLPMGITVCGKAKAERLSPIRLKGQLRQLF
ncbi:hypothetical protein [Rhizobium mongolense]